MKTLPLLVMAVTGTLIGREAIAATDCPVSDLQLPKQQLSSSEPFAHPQKTGNVETYVHVGTDGRIDDVRFLRSSRSRVLDRTAKRVIEMSVVAESCTVNMGNDLAIRASISVDSPGIGGERFYVLRISRAAPPKPDVN